MEKKTAGIILAVLGGVGLIMALINFLLAIYSVYINVENNPDYSNFVIAFGWGIPGFALTLVGLRIIQSERTL